MAIFTLIYFLILERVKFSFLQDYNYIELESMLKQFFNKLQDLYSQSLFSMYKILCYGNSFMMLLVTYFSDKIHKEGEYVLLITRALNNHQFTIETPMSNDTNFIQVQFGNSVNLYYSYWNLKSAILLSQPTIIYQVHNTWLEIDAELIWSKTLTLREEYVKTKHYKLFLLNMSCEDYIRTDIIIHQTLFWHTLSDVLMFKLLTKLD
ncbi:unnamed protein product (macronuclear) [Paramecium tetraurelia]|uniref:Uncharacterized protein n=1 Tax=Paramecium tetraurelia TaxID=5888 RepID=A0BM85_PARTE|nr:uncharacterized protein GSPATT00030286001 [Paramecium tetraurelia]CAK59652.1 unnamed protein product [Paramecium tetraurelia]|eukprot:XP_001427050.1 hypothetical protein (macronuclear) [Paramecium tetraurelia strain d4-2]